MSPKSHNLGCFVRQLDGIRVNGHQDRIKAQPERERSSRERSVTIAEGFSNLGATLTEGERREERRHKSASFVERHFYIEGLWASENA